MGEPPIVDAEHRRLRLRVVLVVAAGALLLAGCLQVVAQPSPAPTTTSTTTSTTTAPISALSPPKTFPPCPTTTGTPRQVVVYGDSLVYQSTADFTSGVCGPDVHVTVEAQPGAALCDFTNFIAAQTAAAPPTVAVIAFSGNNDTPCVEDSNGTPLTGNALLAKYQADAEAVMTDFPPGQTEVLWVTPPGRAGQDQEPPLAAIYQQVASEYPNTMLVDGGKYLRGRDQHLPVRPALLAGRAEPRVLPGRTDRRAAPPRRVPFLPGAAHRADPLPGVRRGSARYGRALAEPVNAYLQHAGPVAAVRRHARPGRSTSGGPDAARPHPGARPGFSRCARRSKP